MRAEDLSTGSNLAETVTPLAHGYSIRCPAFPVKCIYVRFCDAKGNELAFWDMYEWKEDPDGVMGAVLGVIRDPLAAHGRLRLLGGSNGRQ